MADTSASSAPADGKTSSAGKTPKFYLGTQIDGPFLSAEQLYVRQSDLNDLIGQVSYTEALFHILQGRLPTAEERDLFDMVLVAFHGGFGLLPPTTLVPRLVAGTGVSTPQALAAGYLASGPYHVGAVEQAMKLYSEILQAYLDRQDRANTAGELEQFSYDCIAGRIERKETVPGYGHPLLRRDPRPTHTRRLLCDRHITSPYLDVYDGVVRCMREKKGVPPNVDGINAAILLKLGFRTEHGTGLFLLARTAAMLAHIIEEQTDMPYQTMRRFMLLPIAMPRLFNANFKKLTKFFNKLRDNAAFRSFNKVFSRRAKKRFEQREEEDSAAIAAFRAEHNADDLSPQLSGLSADGPQRDEFVAAASQLPPAAEPDEVEAAEVVEELQLSCSPEMLAGAAFLITASLDRLRKGDESKNESIDSTAAQSADASATAPATSSPSHQRAEQLLHSALQMLQEASALVAE